MRLLSDFYACANPYLEPVSLESARTPGDDGGALVDEIVDPAPDPEMRLMLAEAERDIGAFITALDARDRAIFDRVFIGDETQAAVAHAMDISRAAITKRMHRIAQRGRIALADLQRSPVLR
jgi:RNA polymerase sigma factor (sigma-70 family)